MTLLTVVGSGGARATPFGVGVGVAGCLLVIAWASVRGTREAVRSGARPATDLLAVERIARGLRIAAPVVVCVSAVAEVLW